MPRRLLNRRAVLGTVAFGGLFGAAMLRARLAPAVDRPVALDKVPPAAKSAADKAAPGAKWSDAYQETEDGQTVYELEGENADERDVMVEVSADGKVLSIELEIPLSEVPAAVMAAVTGKVANFHASAAFSIRRGADLNTSEPSERAFAIDGTEGEDHEVSAEVTAEGMLTSLERQIPVGGVPQPVMTAIKAKMPMFQISSAHEVSEGDSIVGYILEGTRGAKGNAEATVFVSADGKEVEIDG
jgi:hypothetical protein